MTDRQLAEEMRNLANSIEQGISEQHSEIVTLPYVVTVIRDAADRLDEMADAALEKGTEDKNHA